MKRFLLIFIVAIVAAAAGWFAARRSAPSTPAAAGERKVLFYQSAMHPWIKSDQPGNCTICGMKLSPVYEGEKGFGDGMDGVVTLSSNTIQVINVQSEPVQKRTLVKTLRVAGMIDDDDTRHRRLSAYADGRIEKLFVNFVGAEVVEGQPLAVFYSPMLLTAESEFLSIVRQPLAAEASAALRAERQRLVEAAAQRLMRLGYTEPQVAALTNKAQADARTQIVSPMTGTVVTRNAYEGQYVKEGDVLFEVADFSRMWFVFDAYERDLPWLRVGQSVEISVAALPGRTFTGPIAFIDPNLNDMTRSTRVRVVLENPVVEENGQRRRLLLHKMFANGVVRVELPEVTAIPRSAVLAGGAQPVTYVDLGNGAYEARALKLGRVADHFREVLDGVQPGARVVTEGNLLIDAQAQLNAGASMEGQAPGVSDQTTTTTNGPGSAEAAPAALSEAQSATLREFLAAASAVSMALAADNLAGFNDAAARLHAPLEKLLALANDVPLFRPAVAKLETTGHLSNAKSLNEARLQFVPFTIAVTQLAEQVRGNNALAFKVFECPMVDRGVKGAPKRVRWVQTEGPLRNPFFGAEMLECGKEVR